MRIGKRFKSHASSLVIGNNDIKWCSEIKYLGVVISAATNFKCDFHMVKMKFFRSLNGILGKVGSSSTIHVTLSLVSTYCVPILLYSLEAMKLNKSEL